MDQPQHALHILVDFDNVPVLSRQLGVDHVLHCAIDAATSVLQETIPRHIVIRLYGGWYEGVKLTRKAQRLVQSKYFSSPVPRQLVGSSAGITVLVRAELAKTLISRAGERDPMPFPSTFRTRAIATTGLKTHFPAHPRCSAPTCFVGELGQFLRTGECPYSGAHPDIASCVLRDEQKLVDVLLASDLLHLARDGAGRIVAVVSSDDDLWPAIVQAVPELQAFVHVHTADSGNRRQYEELVGEGRYLTTSLM